MWTVHNIIPIWFLTTERNMKITGRTSTSDTKVVSQQENLVCYINDNKNNFASAAFANKIEFVAVVPVPYFTDAWVCNRNDIYLIKMWWWIVCQISQLRMVG